MKKFGLIKKIYFAIGIFLLSFLTITIFASYNSDPNGASYRVTVGGNDTITQFSPNKKVTNNCGYDIFVPAKTQAEWDAFNSNKPSCATIVDATPIYQWISIRSGYCWNGYFDTDDAMPTCSSSILGQYYGEDCAGWHGLLGGLPSTYNGTAGMAYKCVYQ